LTGGHSGDAVDETRNEPVAAELGDLVLGGTALEHLAVDAALIVDRDHVAKLRRTLDRDQRRTVLGQRLEAALDVLVRNGNGRAGHGQPLVLLELDRRADLDRRLEARGASLGLL